MYQNVVYKYDRASQKMLKGSYSNIVVVSEKSFHGKKRFLDIISSEIKKITAEFGIIIGDGTNNYAHFLTLNIF